LGWIWKKTRKLNLIVLLLTGASWIILGLIVGNLGYCPLTDWHFSILEKLGKTNVPDSYVKYLVDRLTGADFNPMLIYNFTLYSYLIALALSITVNFKDFQQKKH
jgi:hypothetical protein